MYLNQWLQLEGDVSAYLQSLAGHGLVYSGPKQCIPGLPTNSFMSDGCLTDGTNLLAVEIEAAQMHPDTNVGKYWLLQELHPYQRIVLLHVYTPKFNSYPWRKRLGEFYVERMPRGLPIEYIQLDRRDSSDYPGVLQEIKQAIDEQVARLFDTESRPA